MHVERLTLVRASCALRSEQHPPSNLLEGKPWRTDAPAQRAKLVLTLGPPASRHGAPTSSSNAEGAVYAIHSIRATFTGATVVDIASGPLPLPSSSGSASTAIDPRADCPASQDDRGGVHRMQLTSMFQFKSAAAASLGSPPLLSVTLKPVGPSAADGGGGHFTASTLVMTLLCAWEPTQCIGIEALEIYGAIAKTPPPLAVPAVTPTHPAAAYRADVSAAPPKKMHRTDDVVVPHPLHATAAVYPPVLPPPSASAELSSRPPAASPSVAPSPSASVAPGEEPPKPLRGCVVVLSGFVNPLRAELRDKSLSLGAKVKNDWDAEGTHLVAATLHTPKCTQVQSSGHGWIVAKEWVLHAFLAKARPKETIYRLAGDTRVGGSIVAVTGDGGDGGGAGGGVAPPPPTTASRGGGFRMVM